MPELPEVETVASYLGRMVAGACVTGVEFRRPDLRDPIPTTAVADALQNQLIAKVFRRAKYIVVQTDKGWVFIHLGMSGRIDLEDTKQVEKHTHWIWELDGGKRYIRYTDPRRFGRLSASAHPDWQHHDYFRNLGPEPLDLEAKALAGWFQKTSKGRKVPVKNFIMDSRVVVGVGNIYACEALFHARVSPTREAGSLSKAEWQNMSRNIQNVLRDAVAQGGTTIRDFRSANQKLGYFAQKLAVYGRDAQPCRSCPNGIEVLKMQNRSTYHCATCQV